MSYSFFGTCFEDKEILVDCLISMANQSIIPDEIIIIDSSKKPINWKLLDDIFNRKITSIKYENIKLPRVEALNYAITKANSDYLLRFDARTRFSRNYSILPLFAAAFYALLTITAKLFDSQVTSAVVNVYASISSTICAAVITSFLGGFTSISSIEEIFWLIIMGCFGGSAFLLYVVSYRMTEQCNLAPFSYFGIPIAFLFVCAVFDDTPWAALFPGGILIIFGGLLIFWRERSGTTQTS